MTSMITRPNFPPYAEIAPRVEEAVRQYVEASRTVPVSVPAGVRASGYVEVMPLIEAARYRYMQRESNVRVTTMPGKSSRDLVHEILGRR